MPRRAFSAGVGLLKVGPSAPSGPAPRAGPGPDRPADCPLSPPRSSKSLSICFLQRVRSRLHPLRRLQVRPRPSSAPPPGTPLGRAARDDARPSCVRRQKGPARPGWTGETGAVIGWLEHAVPAGAAPGPGAAAPGSAPPAAWRRPAAARPQGVSPASVDPLQLAQAGSWSASQPRRVRVALHPAATRPARSASRRLSSRPAAMVSTSGGKVPLRVQILVLAVQDLLQRAGHEDRAPPPRRTGGSPGPTPSRWPLSRSRAAQKAWTVEIWAL